MVESGTVAPAGGAATSAGGTAVPAGGAATSASGTAAPAGGTATPPAGSAASAGTAVALLKDAAQNPQAMASLAQMLSQNPKAAEDLLKSPDAMELLAKLAKDRPDLLEKLLEELKKTNPELYEALKKKILPGGAPGVASGSEPAQSAPPARAPSPQIVGGGPIGSGGPLAPVMSSAAPGASVPPPRNAEEALQLLRDAMGAMGDPQSQQNRKWDPQEARYALTEPNVLKAVLEIAKDNTEVKTALAQVMAQYPRVQDQVTRFGQGVPGDPHTASLAQVANQASSIANGLSQARGGLRTLGPNVYDGANGNMDAPMNRVSLLAAATPPGGGAATATATGTAPTAPAPPRIDDKPPPPPPPPVVTAGANPLNGAPAAPVAQASMIS